MKKIILSVFYLTFVLFQTAVMSSCDTTPKSIITGTITEAADSMLYLHHTTLDGVQCIDSVKLKADGSFKFKADAPTDCPEFYTLRIGRHIINLSLDTIETVTVNAALPKMESTYTIEGNESCVKIKEISLLQQEVQAKLLAVEKNENMLPGDMVDSVESIIKAYKEKIKSEYLFVKPNSAYAYYAVCQNITDLRGSFMLFNPLADRADVKCYATIATAWDGSWPEAPRTIQLCNMATKGMENTAVPQQKVIEIDDSKVSETGIIDINLPDINTKLHSITELKGKVVMIDFTVYGAAESPERTRALRTLYEKYSSRGFEIYQISLDDDVHFWKYSCENLPWVCVHETNGTATRTYGVANVPTFFLVNRNNEIVLRSDFMKGTLEDEILKLL